MFFNGDIYALQVHAFVAPKIIGGKNAPSPVGDLGMVEMSQALHLIDVCYEQVSRSSFVFPLEVLSFSPFQKTHVWSMFIAEFIINLRKNL